MSAPVFLQGLAPGRPVGRPHGWCAEPATRTPPCPVHDRRADHAIQRKLDAIAAAILEAQEGRTDQAFQDLRNAIRMEEET
jgi:hypothetical protein